MVLPRKQLKEKVEAQLKKNIVSELTTYVKKKGYPCGTNSKMDLVSLKDFLQGFWLN